MQSQLFSGVFYGSLLTIWIAGYLTDHFGPKYFLAFTLADSTITTFLAPYLAETNYYLFFISRIFMGVGEVLIFFFLFVIFILGICLSSNIYNCIKLVSTK